MYVWLYFPAMLKVLREPVLLYSGVLRVLCDGHGHTNTTTATLPKVTVLDFFLAMLVA